jgi:hypothetical protein
MGLLVQHSALGIEGVLGVSFYMLHSSTSYLLPFSIIYHLRFLYINIEKCAIINFNHDHIPMITQTGIDRPQNSARGISVDSVVRMTHEKE